MYNQKIEETLKSIEKSRNKLYFIFNKNHVLSEANLVKKSQKLDKLLDRYYHLCEK